MQHRPRGALLPLSLLALGLCVGGAVQAQDAQDAPAWSLSGFGTVGLVHSGEHQADYTSSVMKYSGAGATRAWSADVDSRLGAQIDFTLNRQWSAVLQMVSEQGLYDTYRPRVEWANIKYQATPELALRVGRIALPIFLAADYRKIGYAYPWVRPPVETYGTVPITSSDGVDATLRWSAGAVRNASQVFYGGGDLPLGDAVHGRARAMLGVSNTSDWGPLTVRVNLMRADLTIDLGQPLFDAFDAFGPAGQAIARNYAVDHKHVSVANVGLNYDPGTWFVMAEAGRTHTGSLLGATRSAYASAGWRWGPFTPYLTWSRVRATGATADPGLPVAALPAPYQAAAARLNAGLNALLTTIPQQTTASAGLRWDAWRNIALKLQYDRVKPEDGSRGTLINTTPGFRSGHPADVVSLALDFVY
jgi:hypothetical protein